MSFSKYLVDKGLMFEPDHVRRFILSLKAKPFVILTGNSGTGKTQLALAYAEYISNQGDRPSSGRVLDPFRDRRWFKLSYNDKEIFPAIESAGGRKLEQIHDLIIENGIMPMGWLDNEEEGRAAKQKQLMRDLKIGDVIVAYAGQFLVGGIGIVNREPFYDDEGDAFEAFNHARKNFVGVDWIVTETFSVKELQFEGYKLPGFGMWVDTIHELSSDQVDTFLDFFENSGYVIDAKPASDSTAGFVLVPVGADWTDKRHLLGFHNVVTGKYQRTRTLDLILKAQADYKAGSPAPRFLILDEMNLSHVERYFADFLSALESGQAIPLHNSSEIQVAQEIPKEVVLPPNLYVIGTVNVDETTYMFSPKVLDRANVIEFKTIAARKYLTSKNGMAGADVEIEFPGSLESRGMMPAQIFGEMAGVTIPGDARTAGFETKITWELDTFQAVLAQIDFDFGFRVINEILRYVYEAWIAEDRPQQFGNWVNYFDYQVLQKMIPKIHGSQKSIGEGLRALYCCCFAGKTDEQVRKLKAGESVAELWAKDVGEARYPKSAAKLRKMQQTLEAQRYISFT